MNNIKQFLLHILILSILSLTACQKHQNCADVITELTSKGCATKQLSKILNLPERVVKNPEKYTFSQTDSLFLFSISKTFKETGKLPDNLYNLYSSNSNNQLITTINNYRVEELKSNEFFIYNLFHKIIEIQTNNSNKFIDNEINSFKALRFPWNSQTEINNTLGEALPKYFDEVKLSHTYNDSCASYLNFISKFRDNGVKRFLRKNGKKEGLQNIGTDIRGFNPQYQYQKSFSDMCYQVLASIERVQDTLFSPINWLLNLLPKWLTITISIILLIILIVSICTRQFHFAKLEIVLFIISLILVFWEDPYKGIRENLDNQISEFYQQKATEELDYLNTKTNEYYDTLINLNKNPNNIRRNTSTVLQTSCEKNDGRSSRTDSKENLEGDSGTGGKADIEINNYANSHISRDKTIDKE